MCVFKIDYLVKEREEIKSIREAENGHRGVWDRRKESTMWNVHHQDEQLTLQKLNKM